jgi:glutamate formiminotransferase
VLFEAVPNFSEGRDEEKISRITEAVRAVPGVRILGLHSDQDHNRSVLTFAGEEDDVLAGSMALARACAAELDLTAQTGEHPRMGVLDVLPFVPLDPATMDDAVRLARRAGELLGALGFPVYLYGAAATAAHRRDLPDVRRGGYEGLASRVEDPRWRSDFGPAEVRERDGGLPAVRALGLEVGGRAQVSMNLTDLRKTPIPVALETVRAAAAERGAAVESTELVGLAPLEAILETARHYLGLRGLEAEHVLEMRLCDTLLHDGASGRNRRC